MNSPETSDAPFGSRPNLACWFALICLAIIPFVGALHNRMIGDDVPIVTDRIQVESVTDLVRLVTENYWGELEPHARLYRPVTLVTLGAEKLLFDETLWPYRVISLVLHACCVLIVFQLTRLTLITRSWSPAWCAAAVFAVHPIHSEAVITLYGQADLLAAAFGLTAVWLYVRFSHRPSLALTLSMCCYMLSLGSKESGVLVPCLAILLRYFRQGVPIGIRSWIANLRWVDFSWILAFGAYLGARIYVLGGDLVPSGEGSIAMDYPVFVRIKLFVVTIAEYIWMLLLPSSQAIYYGHLRDAVFGTPWWQCTILLMSVYGLRELFSKDRRACVLIASTFFLLLFPVSNFIPIGTVVAERAIYLPSVAFAFLVAWIVDRWEQIPLPQSKKRLATIAFALLLIVATGMSWRTAHHWRNPLSLWRYTADCHPRSPKAQALAAIHVLKEMANESPGPQSTDRLDEARRRLEIAKQLNPSARLTVQGLELLKSVEQSPSSR